MSDVVKCWWNRRQCIAQFDIMMLQNRDDFKRTFGMSDSIPSTDETVAEVRGHTVLTADRLNMVSEVKVRAE